MGDGFRRMIAKWILLGLNVVMILAITLTSQFVGKDTSLLQIGVLCSLALVTASSYYNSRKFLSLEMLFFACIFLFLASRVILDFFFGGLPSSYGATRWLADYEFSADTINKISFLISWSILLIGLGTVIGHIIWPANGKIRHLVPLRFDRRIALIIWALGSVAIIYKSIIYFQFIQENSYFALYSGVRILPFYVRILDDFMFLGLALYLATLPKLVHVRRICIVSILVLATTVLSGLRAEFSLSFLVIVWMYTVLKPSADNLRAVMMLLFGIICFSLASALLKNSTADDAVLFQPFTFFYQQGVSVLVLGYYFELLENSLAAAAKFEMFSAPFIGPWRFLTGIERLRADGPEIFPALGHQLIYALSPEKFYAGGGTGSSFIVELYANFGYLGSIPFLVVLGMLLTYLGNRVAYFRGGLFVVGVIAPALFWMPRGSYLLPMTKLFTVMTVLFMIYIFMQVMPKKNIHR